MFFEKNLLTDRRAKGGEPKEPLKRFGGAKGERCRSLIPPSRGREGLSTCFCPVQDAEVLTNTTNNYLECAVKDLGDVVARGDILRRKQLDRTSPLLQVLQGVDVVR